MKEMYLQKNKHSLQHKGVVRATFNKLWQGVEAEIKPIINEDLKIENAPFIQKMKDNVWEFSMAKNTADNIALNNALISPNGKVRSWNEFRKEALKIIDRSARYLKTEYNTAVASARMAAKWERFQREKHIYPYAKFFVVQDNHTSDICAPLHGVVVPWDHPLLKTHFPPNHFNCRTDVEAVRYEEPTPNEQIKAPDIPQNFRNNIGITGKIFAENSLYFEKLNEYFTEDEQKVILGELMSEEQAYVEIYRNKQNRSVLKNNINSDISDYPINQYLGRLIVNNDTDLELRIRYHSKIAGERNPEFEAKQLGLTYIGDATNRTNGTKPQNFILNSVQKLHKGEQLGNFDDVFLILNFGGNEKFSARNINRAGARLHESFKKNPKLKFVYLIANKKVEKIDRRDAIASEVDKFRTLLHSLLRD
ncbi:phage head morphogenesis protein [Ornithobacterium rhinotracheale]|uniref:phage head morphogenesis protein n=1 Tax=Ornithobacterium rhinotracheale TaxID=28251 RepID=UPI001FB88205|nr:phage minor head protein [Ornithobacterium rhinotracheale]UOH77664.1 phage head morphogenesis protein [Ornithobacterium rhinotracheale]